VEERTVQLRRLEVRNIRSYEAGRVDFGPGTTLIVGDVGAGKTSLLYAIEMALFGVAEVDAAYLVRHGAAHAEVAVRFEDGEHRYDVSRRFRRIRRKGRETFESERITFREDGRETSYSATEVRQRVIELLGFPDNPNPQAHSDLWRWAIYVPQERMREILSAKTQERLETIRKALGVERYRTAAENAQDLGADLRASARHRRESAERLGHYDLEFAEATEAADRLRLERGELERNIARSSDELDRCRARVNEAERATRQLEADLREIASLRREEATDSSARIEHGRRSAERASEVERRRKERDDSRLESLELPARRASLASADADARRAREALDRHADGIRALAAARVELAGAERRSADAAARAARALADRDLARTESERAAGEGPAREPPAPTPATLAEIERKLAEARVREHAAVEHLAKTRTALAGIDELLARGICPTCHQSVRPEEFGAHQRDAADSLRRAEEDRRVLAGEIEGIEGERKARERFERAHDRWSEVEKRRESLRDALRRRETELEEAETARAEAERAVRSAKQRVTALEPEERETATLRRAVEETDAILSRERDAVQRATFAEERTRSADDALRSLAEEGARTERELAVLEARTTERGRRIAELLKQTAGAEELAGEARGSRSAVAVAEERLTGERAALVRADTRLDGELRRTATAERGRAERAALVAQATDLDLKAAWATGPFRLHLLAMEQELLAHAQATFDRAFQRYFASLVDDPALVARTDVGFTPEVMIDGEPTPAEALSGGERTALALAFRLALAAVVRSLGEVRLESLLLDEPTDGFSSEQVVRMGELLGELGLPQVIIVSHESQLAGIADRTVRVRKEDGRAILDAERADEPEPVVEAVVPRRTRAARHKDVGDAPK
jgi:DNA repair protein SbcC/Rad50